MDRKLDREDRESKEPGIFGGQGKEKGPDCNLAIRAQGEIVQ